MNYALFAIFLNTALALMLFPAFGFLSVAFATVVAAWVQVFLLGQKLYRQGRFQPGGRLAERLLRILLASFGLSVFLNAALNYTDIIADHLWDRSWLAIIVISGAGLFVYGVLALALGAVRPSDYKSVTGGK